MLRRGLIVFVGAFILNFFWEEAHSALYVSYRGEAITSLILFRAALFDATVITLFYFLFSRLPERLQKVWFLLAALTVFAIGLEEWALTTDRWAYTSTMPIIPFLAVGLTPAIQLGVLGYISLKISHCLKS